MFLFNKINSKYTACDFVDSGLIFSQKGIVNVCPIHNDIFVIDRNFQGINFDLLKIRTNLTAAKSKFTTTEYLDVCNNCHNLKKIQKSKTQTLKKLYLSHWSCCHINCKHCKREKYNEIEDTKHFSIQTVIQQMLDNKLIDKTTQIVFDCGDATVHPDFDKLLYFFIDYEMKNIIINSPSVRFCQSIADAISKNIATVIISLDSGCAYIYEKIKGINRFDFVISTIKRYLEYQDKNQKRVILKYTMLKGINDNNKEILDWFILSRNLGVKKLLLDIEDDWFFALGDKLPDFLEDLIIFTKELSKLNNFDIEFTSKIENLYKRINPRDK